MRKYCSCKMKYTITYIMARIIQCFRYSYRNMHGFVFGNHSSRFQNVLLCLKNIIFFFPYSYRNTSGSLEIFLQTFTSVSITYRNMRKNVLYFSYKITRRKLKRRNRLLYRRVNYCSWWRMRWRIMARLFPCFPYSYRNTAFNQSKLTFSKWYFIK